MTELEKLAENFKKFNSGKAKIIAGTVKDVDDEKLIATVEFDSIEVEVRITSVIDDNANKSYLLPKKDSWVLIISIGGSDSDYVIIAYSEIEKLYVKSDDIILGDEDTAEKVILGEKAKSSLNDIETHLQTMNTLLLTFANAQVMAISAVPLLAPLAPAYATLVTGLTSETAKISKMIADLKLILSDKVKIA